MKSLRWLKIGCLSTLMLAACTTSLPSFDEPESVAEMQSVQTHFSQAHYTENKSWAPVAPMHAKSTTLTWQFNPYKGISFTVPAGSLDIQPSTNGLITIKLYNDPQASMQGAVVDNTLALKINPYQGGKVVLYLPEATKYLMLRNFSQIDSLEVRPLYLNLMNCAKVNFQARDWMLEYAYFTQVNQANLEGIATPYLLTWVKWSGKVSLQGKMSLRELDVQDGDSVTLYNISSPIMTANIAGNSSVFLAGHATVGNITLKDASVADLRYLPTERLFIKASDRSQAQVTATDGLNGLARDFAFIGYYHQPKLLSRYLYGRGAILYMAEAPPPCDLPYCPALPKALPG